MVMPNFDDITKILAIIGTVLGGIVGINKGLEAYRKKQRSRQLPAGDFPFEVFKPHSSDLLKHIMGGDEKNPLADYKIPYQERQPDRNVRQELEDAFSENNWVLILGKSGLGKTREAAHLAEVLNQEGWTVLKLADQVGEWLDVPKEFPSQISPDDKLLFFLDDLNRWMYAGNPHEIHPKAGEELARPLRESVQERLPRLLQYFEHQGKSPYVRVIATARDEHEPDKVGDTSPWDKLQWEKYKSFWQQFRRYSLVEPSEGAVVSLLTDCVAAAGLRGVSEEYGQIARRNDGTFQNIILNLDKARNRGLTVNNKEFSPKLDETWRERYNYVVQLYPLAVYAYDAVELLRTLNLWLTPPMLSATTKHLLRGRGVRRWWQEWQLRSVLRYLVTTKQILKPKDGQIEAKKTGAVDVGRYLPVILQLLGQMAKKYPTYPVAAECFDCGKALHKMGLYEDAISSYDHTLKIKPDADQAWNNRGVALSDLGRKEEAITSYDNAIEINPDYHIAWNNRGNALSNLGRNGKMLTKLCEAITSYDNAIEINPDGHEAWYNRGLALSDLGRKEEAITSYDKVLEFNLDDHEAWYSRGLALSDLGRNEDAIISYDKALKIKPDYHTAWNSRGNALSNLGCDGKALTKFYEAITSYDKALEFKPDDHEAWYNRGLTLSDLERKEEAITSYDKAIEFKSDYHEAWHNRGLALSDLGRKEEAITSYDKAIEFKPDCYRAWGNRGLALSNLGRKEEAITSYDKVLKIKPDDYQAWGNRGIALSDLGRKEEAITSYNEVLEIKPNDHNAWGKQGIALSDLGRNEDAITSFDHALRIKPDDHKVWCILGLTLSTLGRNDEAITSYDQALRIKSDDHKVWCIRGLTLSALGHNDEAIASYNRALLLSPNDAEVYYNKACCYGLQKNIDLAIDTLQQAINLDSECRELAETDSDFDGIRQDDRFQSLIGA